MEGFIHRNEYPVRNCFSRNAGLANFGSSSVLSFGMNSHTDSLLEFRERNAGRRMSGTLGEALPIVWLSKFVFPTRRYVHFLLYPSPTFYFSGNVSFSGNFFNFAYRTFLVLILLCFWGFACQCFCLDFIFPELLLEPRFGLIRVLISSKF